MEKINNEHGIEMYCTISGDLDKVDILDSHKRYFDDLYIDADENEDYCDIIQKLENVTLYELINLTWSNKKVYNSLDELTYDLQDPEITEDNDYVNIFKVNDKKYYVWSE